MERAVRLLKSKRFPSQILNDDDIARAAWPLAVGKPIAAHTLRIRVVRSTLVVEVEDGIWQKQLYPLTAQILARYQKVMGSDAIKEIEFRIGIPRREAQRASSSTTAISPASAAPDDEAEHIQDAVLRKIYRLSRKKATA